MIPGYVKALRWALSRLRFWSRHLAAVPPPDQLLQARLVEEDARE
jgi:hypothetical protein